MTPPPEMRTSLGSFIDAYIQSALQLMVVIDHMRESIARGRSNVDAPPIDVVLEDLFAETFGADSAGPSRRDFATAARVLNWAMDTTSSEIYLVPHELEPEDVDPEG
jgi:hypothetical protein